MSFYLAFYGAGASARPYLDALARRPDVQLTAVCDLDRRTAEQVAAGWNAQVFLSYDAMLSEVRPDALWVCVAPHLQGDVLLRAVEQRIPFFVAPPGAMTHERAVAYGQAVRDANLVTAVGFPTAYVDVAREAREYVGTNPVPLALGWWLRPAREAPGASALSLLWNEACQTIHALRQFCGEVMRVQAFAAGRDVPAESAGGLVLHLTTDRGTAAVLTLATFPRPEPRVELELLGDGWTLVFGEGMSSLRVDEPDKTTILRRMNDPAADHVTAFLDAVTKGSPSAVEGNYGDALRTLAVCDAAAVSAREGRPVDVTT